MQDAKKSLHSLTQATFFLFSTEILLSELLNILSNLDSLHDLFLSKKLGSYLVIYTFRGRQANQTITNLLTRTLSDNGYLPLNYILNDYSLGIFINSKIRDLEEIISIFFNTKFFFKYIQQGLKYHCVLLYEYPHLNANKQKSYKTNHVSRSLANYYHDGNYRIAQSLFVCFLSMHVITLREE